MTEARMSPVLAAFNADLDRCFGAEFEAANLEDQRSRYDRFWRRYHAPMPAGIETRDYAIPIRDGATIAARLYRPETPPSPMPLCLYFHGGGWAFGSIDSHDLVTARLADQAGVAILSVEYRLAPEHKYPVPFQDCWDALVWAHEKAGELGVDTAGIGVAGDSAGGALAAGIALMARDRGGPEICHQALIYPGLGDRDLGFYLDLYLADPIQARDPYAMPLRAGDLSRLPGAVILVAGMDILRGDGEAYAARLSQAGIEADLITVEGLPHTFLRIIHLEAAAAAAFAAFCRKVAKAHGCSGRDDGARQAKIGS